MPLHTNAVMCFYKPGETESLEEAFYTNEPAEIEIVIIAEFSEAEDPAEDPDCSDDEYFPEELEYTDYEDPDYDDVYPEQHEDPDCDDYFPEQHEDPDCDDYFTEQHEDPDCDDYFTEQHEDPDCDDYFTEQHEDTDCDDCFPEQHEDPDYDDFHEPPDGPDDEEANYVSEGIYETFGEVPQHDATLVDEESKDDLPEQIRKISDMIDEFKKALDVIGELLEEDVEE